MTLEEKRNSRTDQSGAHFGLDADKDVRGLIPEVENAHSNDEIVSDPEGTDVLNGNAVDDPADTNSKSIEHDDSEVDVSMEIDPQVAAKAAQMDGEVERRRNAQRVSSRGNPVEEIANDMDAVTERERLARSAARRYFKQ